VRCGKEEKRILGYLGGVEVLYMPLALVAQGPGQLFRLEVRAASFATLLYSPIAVLLPHLRCGPINMSQETRAKMMKVVDFEDANALESFMHQKRHSQQTLAPQ
jgi:hypothetical protein